ncbi:alanyl-tRNA editing protein, partial [Bacillus thuringiensis]|nr:alanyl-tRNA editing protein [Bacillus thuringiensis]
ACGGTHVKNTSEIGTLVIDKVKSKGKQNRRFEVRAI